MIDLFFQKKGGLLKLFLIFKGGIEEEKEERKRYKQCCS